MVLKWSEGKTWESALGLTFMQLCHQLWLVCLLNASEKNNEKHYTYGKKWWSEMSTGTIKGAFVIPGRPTTTWDVPMSSMILSKLMSLMFPFWTCTAWSSGKWKFQSRFAYVVGLTIPWARVPTKFDFGNTPDSKIWANVSLPKFLNLIKHRGRHFAEYQTLPPNRSI